MFEVRQAAKLNNEGVDALSRSDFPEAIKLFTDSLCLMKTGLAGPAMPGTPSSVADNQMRAVGMPNMTVVDINVFSEAIVILSSTSSDVETSKPDGFQIQMYIAAIIFNLALTHHFTALSCSSRAASCTVKAERLYGMVLKLMDDNEVSPITLVLRLACINNMSRIYLASRSYENARAMLLSHISSLRVQESYLEEPDVQGLWIGLLLLLDSNPEVAAAAA